MEKKYYEKGRLKYFSRNQLIVFDYPTIAAISYSLAVFLFGSLILLSLKQWTKLLDAIPPKTSPSTALEKKEGDAMALDFIEIPADIPQQLKSQEQAPIPEKLIENLQTKPDEKLVKIEPELLPKPKAETKPEPIVKKAKLTDIPPEMKAQEVKLAPKVATGSTSITPDNQSPIALHSTTEAAETEEHIFYRKLLESMIEEKIKPYKSEFPDKWKAIAGSYIVELNISANDKVEIKLVTSSPNFFFNHVSSTVISSIKYPSLKTYGLKSYHQTFIFTYRPYGKQQ